MSIYYVLGDEKDRRYFYSLGSAKDFAKSRIISVVMLGKDIDRRTERFFWARI